jgi:hypothetical protein
MLLGRRDVFTRLVGAVATATASICTPNIARGRFSVGEGNQWISPAGARRSDCRVAASDAGAPWTPYRKCTRLRGLAGVAAMPVTAMGGREVECRSYRNNSRRID